MGGDELEKQMVSIGKAEMGSCVSGFQLEWQKQADFSLSLMQKPGANLEVMCL